MVNPAWREKGVGRALYETFFQCVRTSGRKVIRCAISPDNKRSIAFHARLGFGIEPQEQELDGVPVCRDYNGWGEDRVVLKKFLQH